jgi:hypothetical protein
MERLAVQTLLMATLLYFYTFKILIVLKTTLKNALNSVKKNKCNKSSLKKRARLSKQKKSVSCFANKLSSHEERRKKICSARVCCQQSFNVF